MDMQMALPMTEEASLWIEAHIVCPVHIFTTLDGGMCEMCELDAATNCRPIDYPPYDKEPIQ
jgi:hypothetical protein